jgi:hypothetical protein
MLFNYKIILMVMGNGRKVPFGACLLALPLIPKQFTLL